MPGGGSKPGERRGGRQKGTPNRWTDVRQAFASEGPAAVDFIVGIMNNKGEPTETRLKAAKEVLDRGFGKAAQPLRADRGASSYDITKLTDEQLRLGYELARAASTGIGDTD